MRLRKNSLGTLSSEIRTTYAKTETKITDQISKEQFLRGQTPSTSTFFKVFKRQSKSKKQTDSESDATARDGTGLLKLIAPGESPSIESCMERYILESSSSSKLEKVRNEKFLARLVRHWVYKAVSTASNIIETTGNLSYAKYVVNEMIHEALINDENILDSKTNKKIASETARTIIAGLHSGVGTVQQTAQIFIMLEAQGSISSFSQPDHIYLHLYSHEETLSNTTLPSQDFTLSQELTLPSSTGPSVILSRNNDTDMETCRCSPFKFVIQNLFSGYGWEKCDNDDNYSSGWTRGSLNLSSFFTDSNYDSFHLDSGTLDESRNDSSLNSCVHIALI